MRLRPSRYRTTLAREAYLAVRSAILDRTVAPGEKLILRELSEALGLSPTPIKEALVALSREGLVESKPHRGYYVPLLTLEDMDEIYSLREVVEGLSARLATLGRDSKLITTLPSLMVTMQESARERDFERYGDNDLALHRALWIASRNKRLAQFAEAISGQIRLFITTSAKLPGRLDASLDEHAVLVQAVLAGDSQTAEHAMRRHVRQAWSALRSHFGEPRSLTAVDSRVQS